MIEWTLVKGKRAQDGKRNCNSVPISLGNHQRVVRTASQPEVAQNSDSVSHYLCDDGQDA